MTQSIKKLPAEDRKWALDGEGFKRLPDNMPVNLTDVKDKKHSLFYKDCPYTTKKLHQRLIITYSPKYTAYQKELRRRQVERIRRLLLQMTANGSIILKDMFTHAGKRGILWTARLRESLRFCAAL